MTTIQEATSRVRNIFKAVNEDAFLTDRLIYSILLKFSKALIRRQDNESKLMVYDSLFETLPFVELIEVDKIEADCAGIKTGCTFRRTKYKLPKVYSGSNGPIFRNISPIDFSDTFQQISSAIYVAMSRSTNFKYNKCHYFWYNNGHLYFPDIKWDAVMIEAMWEDPLDGYCDKDECTIMQEKSFNLPEYLFAEMEQMSYQELMMLAKIPTDTSDDKQNVIR
ncbi:MAG: Cellulophaga phage phi4:1 [Bacteroidota bacterium]|jgi:hypothetical protein